MKYLIIIFISLFLFSCSKDYGCNDLNADNYDSSTNMGDSGGDRASCTYPIITVTNDSLVEFSGEGGKNNVSVYYIAKRSTVNWRLSINYPFHFGTYKWGGQVRIQGYWGNQQLFHERYYYKDGLTQEYTGTFAIDSGDTVLLDLQIYSFKGQGAFYFY